MSEMRLTRLTLRNFKGISEFILDAQGENVTVYGDNAAGKTTLFDAFTWLLFDKDSQNRKDFAIKTLDAAGQVMHGLEHEVEGVFEIGSRTLTLRKIYTEKWTKKRGSATAEFTGHETNHFVDGVPVTKGEYAARVAEIADESVFRLLTDPAYFNEQLHWQERRRILLQVCGDVSDEDVIASDPQLGRLPEILRGRKLDDHRKVISARRAEINRELQQIPVRISEVQRGLPDVSGLDRAALKVDVAGLRVQRRNAEQERVRLEAGGEVAAKTVRLREVEAELLEIERGARAEADRQAQQVRQELARIADQVGAVDLEIKGKRREIESNSAGIARLETLMTEYRAEWTHVDGQQFVFEQDHNCPACGQALPAERLEEAREKALAVFNCDKARQLQDITERGKRAKAEAETLRQQNERLAQEIAGLETRRAELDAEKAAVPAPTAAPDLTADLSYRAKLKEKEAIEATITQLRTSGAEVVAQVARRIEQLDGQIRALETSLAALDQHERGLARIEELKAQERTLAAEFEDLEHQVYLTEQFIRIKVQLLESRINSRFKLARFKLFEQQVNGGISEVCETTFDGVPYGAGLNNGARINVGLDICNTLAEHYGIMAPIWVDNAEAVTRLIPTLGQLVKLVVSAADKALRVEREEALVNA